MAQGSGNFRGKLVASVARWFDELVQERVPGQPDKLVVMEAVAAILEAHLKTVHPEDRLCWLQDVVDDVVQRLHVSAPDTVFNLEQVTA